MILPFDFHNVPRIVFGRGRLRELGGIARSFGRRALVVHNADAAVGRIGSLLSGAGVEQVVYRQRGEPQVEHVDEAAEVGRGCDIVVGLGGGSAIDAAKAVAGLLTSGGSALDYMEVVGAGRKIERPGAPLVAVPTTAGTGAEATRNAVIGYPQRQFKASIRSEHLLARVALVDAELGAGVSPEVTARSGMDALCQLIESYTSRGANPMSDALALRGIELAGRSLLRAYRDGADLDARDGMALAALLSGITLTNAGLGAVHGFAAPLGANFPVPHGTVCAALLPHVIRANAAAMRAQSPDHPGLGRYLRVAQAMETQDRKSEISDFGLSAAVESLVLNLNIPRLGRYGLTPAHVPEMVALARKSSSMRYNPVDLSEVDLTGILAAAI